MKKALQALLGVLLIGAGLLGLVLPFLPGWILIFTGLSFLSPRLAEKIRHRVLLKLLKQEAVWLDAWQRKGVRAGFTTRHAPLFLRQTGDLLAAENQVLLSRFFESPAGESKRRPTAVRSYVFLDQVHADHVAVLTRENEPPARFFRIPACDGVLTDRPGVALLVFSADCLPVFLRAGGWIGVVHAGWRGTEKKIAVKALRLIAAEAGVPVSKVHILFGPAIGRDHYEVGEEFRGRFPSQSFQEKGGALFFDLAGENRRQLVESGASRHRITDLGLCTVCEIGNFYSFRQEKDAAGRMVSFILKT